MWNLPSQVKTQYLQIQNIVDTSIKHPISSQSTTVVKDCMYIWLMWQILPLVMEEHWSCANFFKNLPRYNKVVCMGSEMEILHFYLVGQKCMCSLNHYAWTNYLKFSYSNSAGILWWYKTLICNTYFVFCYFCFGYA